MATAPKSAPKSGAEADAGGAQQGAPKSQKKLLLLIGILLIALIGGGGAAWYFLSKKSPPVEEDHPKPKASKTPVFFVIESFTVNLQPETGEQFLQIAFTLQVEDQAQIETMKMYMPQVRSRLLILLSGKKPSEISTVDGKQKLADDIVAVMKKPFSADGPPQLILNVFFTSFVIQ